MEGESRKLQLFTDSRFKLKSVQQEKTIYAIEELCNQKVAEIQTVFTDAENAVKYRLDDFRIQMDGRVTKEYVEVIGRQIKSSIIDSVSAVNPS